MKKAIYFFLVITLFLSGCIDQIDLEGPSEFPVVVIDGVFTDQQEEQLIKVSKSILLQSQVSVPVTGADIYVEDQDGNRIVFLEREEGEYRAEAKAEQGKQYRLFGILSNGKEITSNLQQIPKPFPIDNISLIDTLVTYTDESGAKRRIHSLDFFAHSNVNAVESDRYLRFSPQTVYQISDIVCSPFIAAKSCYFHNDVRPLILDLIKIDPSENPVQFTNFVYRRKIDNTMGEVFALDLRLYSYNKEEFSYWEKLKSLFDQNGNITDTSPARISGNITANDGSEIQGQFAVVSKSRKLKIVRNSDFPTQQLPYCGLPGLRPYPLPSACCGCHILPGAQLEKPDYWP